MSADQVSPPPRLTADDIQVIGVIGAGQMGGGIAHVAALAGAVHGHALYEPSAGDEAGGAHSGTGHKTGRGCYRYDR